MLSGFKRYVETIRKNSLLVIILAFIVLVSVKVLLSLDFSSPYIMMDEMRYDDAASNILNGKLYGDMVLLKWVGTYPPGYPIVISPAYLLSEDKSAIYHWMLAINAIISTSIIFPAYFILRKYAPAISIPGALAVAVLPSTNLYTFTLMSENLFIPLTLFSIWFLIKSYETDDIRWELLASTSVAYLYLTRTHGMAMLAGFIASFYLYLNRKSKNIIEMIWAKKYLLLPFICLILFWFAYTTFSVPEGSYSMGSPYKVEGMYAEKIASSNDIDTLLAYLKIFLNEMDYLLLASCFMVLPFVAFIISLIRKKDTIEKPVMIGLAYFGVSAIALVCAVVLFMSFLDNIPRYLIYGRYIEPLLPPLLIFGLIGLDKISGKGQYARPAGIAAYVSLMIISTMVIAATIPLEHYNLINTFSIYYLQTFKDMPGKYLSVIVFSLLSLAAIYLALLNKKCISLVMVLIIVSSIVFSISPYQRQLLLSDNNKDDFTKYIESHSTDRTITVMDKDMFNDMRATGTYLWAMMSYWNKNDILLADDVTNTTRFNGPDKEVQYILSSKLLPYKKETMTYFDYYLYNVTGKPDDPVTVPYTIDLGVMDIGYIYNFNMLDSPEYRWTKDTSSVIIEYPAHETDMNLTIVTLGPRPDSDPASVEFLMNGNMIGETVKPSGNFTYTFTVPAGYLNDYYNILEIKTNTWNPEEYGMNDRRSLGIAIDYILIDCKNTID